MLQDLHFRGIPTPLLDYLLALVDLRRRYV
jgi:hypothetical protein